MLREEVKFSVLKSGQSSGYCKAYLHLIVISTYLRVVLYRKLLTTGPTCPDKKNTYTQSTYALHILNPSNLGALIILSRYKYIVAPGSYNI